MSTGNGNGNGASAPEPSNGNGKPKRKRRRNVQGSTKGRPRKLIPKKDLEKIAILAGYGLTEGAIGHTFGMNADTFTRRKADQPGIIEALERGKAIAAERVGEALFNLATGITIAKVGKVTGEGEEEIEEVKIYKRRPLLGAIVWFEKTRQGRKDPTWARAGDTPGEQGDTAPDGNKIIPLDTLRYAVRRAEARQAAEGSGNGKRGLHVS